jgi:hypothetical protein
MMGTLAHHIEAIAFRSANGELAWRPDDVGRALAEITRADMACLGGELRVVNDGVIAPWFKRSSSDVATFFGWDTAPRQDDETWHDFIARCQQESTAAIRTFSVDDVKMPEGQIYFNLSYVTESELDQIQRSFSDQASRDLK